MKYTNKTGLPKQIINACLEDDGHEPVPNTYHVTELIKPVKQSILERRYWDTIELDASDCVWLVFGKAVHEVLQYGNISNFQQAEKYIERELKVDADTVKIVGRMDLYQSRWKTIVDWKTATTTKVLHGDYEEYRRQGLEYAWILQGQGIQAGHLKFTMFLKDWSKGQLRMARLQGKPYPESAIHIWEYTITKKDMEEIDQWIRDRIRTIRECEKTPDDLIPTCSDEERWASPTRYAVMRDGRKSAVKLCDTPEEAQSLINSGQGDRIEIRLGISRRCEDYCLVKDYCRFYKETKEEI